MAGGQSGAGLGALAHGLADLVEDGGSGPELARIRHHSKMGNLVLVKLRGFLPEAKCQSRGSPTKYESSPCYSGDKDCPVHGEWCPWGRWKCPKCGEMASRTRRCQCPLPEKKGLNCFGEKEEYLRKCQNNCTNVEEVPTEVQSKVNDYLLQRRGESELRRNVGDKAEMECPDDLIDFLHEKFPQNGGIFWTLNRQPLTHSSSSSSSSHSSSPFSSPSSSPSSSHGHRQFLSWNRVLRIAELRERDSGIYASFFRYSKLSKFAHFPIAFFALTVETTRASQVVRSGESVSFPCNDDQIYEFLPFNGGNGVKIVQTWVHNESVARSCEGTECSRTLNLDSIRQMDAGIWECTLNEMKKGRKLNTWRTNFMRIEVGPPKALWVYLLERPTLLCFLLAGKACLVIVACGLMVRKIKSEENRRKDQMSAFVRWRTNNDAVTDSEGDTDFEGETDSAMETEL